MAISESVAWTDWCLKALLLISRGTDELDGESGTELTLRFYQRQWKMQVAFWEAFASGSPSRLVQSTVENNAALLKCKRLLCATVID